MAASTDFYVIVPNPVTGGHALIVTADGVYFTLDGGQTWTASALPDGLSLPTYAFGDGQTFYATGPWMVSIDGGQSFTVIDAPPPQVSGPFALDTQGRIHAGGVGIWTLSP
jgi:hypothetical protein